MTVDWFAGLVAERYDDGDYSSPEVVVPAVDFLEPLAAGGALELAIGTGRIALPLEARGARVQGIDLSLPQRTLHRSWLHWHRARG